MESALNTFINDAFWFGVGAIATLVGAFVAHRVGFVQIQLMKRAGVLDDLRTRPKVGVRIRIDGRQPNGVHYPTVYYLMIKIYNEGDLAASNVKGQCSVYSSTQEISKREIPFHTDFLGTRPLHTEGLLYGATLEGAMRGQETIDFNADIDFTYETGIPEDQPQQYKAKYKFDGNTRSMVKV